MRAVLAAEVLSTTGTAMLGVAAVPTLAATSFLLATRAARSRGEARLRERLRHPPEPCRPAPVRGRGLGLAVTVVLGVLPQPVLDLAGDASRFVS